MFQDTDGVYRPPKFMPTSIDDEEKRRKKDSRRDKALARVAIENPYIKEMIDDAADRPEEVCVTFALNLLARVSYVLFIFMLNNLSGIYSGRKQWAMKAGNLGGTCDRERSKRSRKRSCSLGLL